jgi:uncharacterized protein YgbK (DUF1537 family)
VYNLDCRHDCPQPAYDKVFAAAARWRGTDVPVYIKTDSALRGNLAPAFRAAMDALGLPIAFIPALPGMNRVTREGVHYIDGVPLAQSSFAVDPRSPMVESYIPALLEGLETELVRAGEAAGWLYDPAARKVYLFDCESNGQMADIADLLAGQGALRLCAGCAGLAGELHRLLDISRQGAEAVPSGKGLLVVSGSANPRSTGQIEAAGEEGAEVIHITPGMILDGDLEALGRASDRAAAVLAEGGTVIAAAVRSAEDRQRFDRLAEERGIPEQELPELILPCLAEFAARTLEKSPEANLFVFGGDTARAILLKLGCGEVRPGGEIELGVPVSAVEWRGKILRSSQNPAAGLPGCGLQDQKISGRGGSAAVIGITMARRQRRRSRNYIEIFWGGGCFPPPRWWWAI